MKIQVTERCTGHGRCYVLAPSVYSSDDEGYNEAVGQPIEVPDHLVDEARRGVQNCPEGALEIIE